MGDIIPTTDPAIGAARAERGATPSSLAGTAAECIGAAVAALPWREVAMGAACLICALLLVRHGGGSSLMLMAVLAVASCASSVAGFAFSAIAGAMLFHLSGDTVRVVQIMMTCSIANQAAMTWDLRRTIEWRSMAPLLAAGTAGVGFGVWLLLHTARANYTVALGLFLVGYGAYMLLRRPVVFGAAHPGIDAAVALVSGVAGGAVGFPGALVAPWCGMRGWDKARQRAVFQPFILLMQVVALLSIGLARHSAGGQAGFDATNLLFIPASLLGTGVGMALYQRLSDRQFGRVVNLALIVSGISYVV